MCFFEETSRCAHTLATFLLCRTVLVHSAVSGHPGEADSMECCMGVKIGKHRSEGWLHQGRLCFVMTGDSSQSFCGGSDPHGFLPNLGYPLSLETCFWGQNQAYSVLWCYNAIYTLDIWYIYTYTCICIYVCVWCMCKHTHICMYIYLHIYIYIYTMLYGDSDLLSIL